MTRHRILLLSAATTVAGAVILAVYCYASEYLGFNDLLFLHFDNPGKALLSPGYRFLEAYSLVVSVLAAGSSLAVCRRHPRFAIAGLLVAGALFTWSVILPRY